MDSEKVFKIVEGVNFTCIPSVPGGVQFKNNLFSINFFVPLESETAGVNALVTKILANSCKKFPDFAAFNRHLEDLYGASISSDIEKIGEVHVLSFSAVSINDKYVFDETRISSEICRLLCEIIFNPNADENSFNESVFEQEKRQLIEQVQAEMNDKKVYAGRRCIQEMCHDEKFGINKLGESENIVKLTNKKVFKAWKNLLKSARVEAIFIGEVNPNEIIEILKDNFAKIRRSKILEYSTKVVKEVEKVHEVIESMEIKQSKLVMGFRAGSAEPDDDTVATYLMTMIFGGTPYSKLFLNVREKMSLCYYCNAAYDKIKGIIVVSSGVDNVNVKKAKDEILKQLGEIRNGNVTDDEIKQTKDSIIQAFMKVKDSLFKIENFEIIQKIVGKSESIEEFIEKIKSITKEQIVEAAKKAMLDTVYILTERSGE